MSVRQNRGVIDTTNRVLSEVLQKPAVKESIRTVLQNIDPESSPDLVKTLLWKDIEVPLGIVGALPAITNSFIRAVDAALEQINEKFPPELLQDFARSLLGDLDKESLARLKTNLKHMLELLAPVFREVAQSGQTPADTGVEERQYEA